jgi:hypothetical protein
MNGHNALIALRRAGLKPAFVWVADFPCKADWDKWGEQPQICVHTDTPELEDFRFLVGITAIVDGQDPARVERIARACAAHAKRVISNVFRSVDGRVELTCIADTDEVLTWQI